MEAFNTVSRKQAFSPTIKEADIRNKSILYIGPSAFHYDQFIIHKLKQRGANVRVHDLEDLKPPINLYTRVMNKLNARFEQQEIQRHRMDFSRHVLAGKEFDYVLVRQGFQMEEELVANLRKKNPGAKFINFHWDSIRPEYDILHIVKYFDTIFSFDFRDCQTQPNFRYLPLFFIDAYKDYYANHKRASNFKYDLLFIGAWRNMERYQLIKKTEALCRESGLSFYHYLYHPPKYLYHNFRHGIKTPEARYKKLSHHEILSYFSKSNTIIDFPSSFQTGLTIRTFETLGSGKKLMTTNKNILNEPFYDPEYIEIIDLDHYTLNPDFIRNHPSHSMEEKMKDYSLDSYINKLFD